MIGPPTTDGGNLEIAPNFAWVSWDTTDGLQGCVQWGPTDSYGDDACEPETGIDHRLLMSALRPLHTYHYRIGFNGPEGPVFGPDHTFVTLPEEAAYSDDFNYPNLDRELWSLVDPNGRGTLAMEGAGTGDAGVRLTTPPLVDYSVDGVDRSLRLLQAVGPGPFVNLVELTAELDCPGESCGTVWKADEHNYVRFGFEYYMGDVYLTGVLTEGDVALESERVPVIFGSWTGEFPLHLAVEHQAQSWRATWSFDGLTWHPGVELQRALVAQTGGLYVSGGEGYATGVSVSVDSFFDSNFPIVPEDEIVRVDRTAPYIYRLEPEVLSDSDLRLSWYIDEPCHGGLDWGVAPNFEFHEMVDGFSYGQRVRLSGLEEDTVYVLRARALDASGHETLSEEVELETGDQGDDDDDDDDDDNDD
ncbi:MAG: hypothetical protein ACI8QC_001130 [Planctomycetota bacterium]